MALSSSPTLPIIDFTKEAMKPGTTTWDLTSKQVLKALEDNGCFMATFNEINHELYTDMFRSLEKLYDLPKDTKQRLGSGVKKGYTSDMPQNPLFESMTLPDALSFEAIQNFTLLMWPQGNDFFCKTLHSYLTMMYEIEKTVRKMIFQNYGVNFEKEYESMGYSTRMMKYGAPMTDIPSGARSHYDHNMITLLQSDGVGLQVYSKSTDKWIDATPSASSIVVMAGESFHGWSNGRVKCALHQVKLSGSKPRYSIGLFSTKKGTIEIPNEVVDEQHPRLFKPFDVDGLLEVFLEYMKDKSYTGTYENVVPSVVSHFAI